MYRLVISSCDSKAGTGIIQALWAETSGCCVVFFLRALCEFVHHELCVTCCPVDVSMCKCARNQTTSIQLFLKQILLLVV